MRTGGAEGAGGLGVKGREGLSEVESLKPLVMAAGRWASADCILGSYDVIDGKPRSRGRPGGYKTKNAVEEAPIEAVKHETRENHKRKQRQRSLGRAGKPMVAEAPIEAKKPGTGKTMDCGED
jgi:hypothetical protein